MTSGERLVDGEERWQPARLIPTSGIKGVDEQEKRATSALLSVMMAVPDFSKILLRKANAIGGSLKTYIEPEFTLETDQKTRPDGAMIVRRGSNTWKAFVEVKTGTNELRADQIEGYLDLARELGFDAVVTISNQLASAADSFPISVDRKKTKKVGLFHWSWVEILTEAVLQREHRGIKDPDQAWILAELIAYLKHPQSGAMQFQDMGPHWVTVREAAREGMLRPQDIGVSEVVGKWDQFIQYLCLHLAGDLGVDVTHVLSKQERDDPASRRHALVRQLVQTDQVSVGHDSRQECCEPNHFDGGPGCSDNHGLYRCRCSFGRSPTYSGKSDGSPVERCSGTNTRWMQVRRRTRSELSASR